MCKNCKFGLTSSNFSLRSAKSSGVICDLSMLLGIFFKTNEMFESPTFTRRQYFGKTNNLAGNLVWLPAVEKCFYYA